MSCKQCILIEGGNAELSQSVNFQVSETTEVKTAEPQFIIYLRINNN